MSALFHMPTDGKTEAQLHQRTTEIRIDTLERAQTQLYEKLEENTSITSEIKRNSDEQAKKMDGMSDDLAEIIDAFRAGKGAFKVLGFLGKVAKWATIVLAFITAVYAFLHAIKTGLPK